MTKAMHILLAPDSFKGTLTSRQVIEAPVSYTHLDVYKRQGLPSDCKKMLPAF